MAIKKKTLLILSVTICALVLASIIVGMYLSTYSEFREYAYPKPEPLLPPPLAYKEGAEQAPESIERMLIYNAYISLETQDIQGTLDRIIELVKSYDGYIASSSISTYEKQTVAEITVRVPKDRFHEAVKRIEEYGKLLDEQTSSEDITEHYIDLKARLENLKKQEKRLHEILEIAKTVEEILTIERELERIRGEIESLQGQINYLERSVAMSVISIRLIEPAPSFTPPTMDLGKVLETSLRGLFFILQGLIIIFVSSVPLVAIAIPLYYVYKKRKSHKK
ncbi:MAG: DUF4349 domain-containing protein [Candidatus Bathyarchaeia archaeon]